MNAEKAMKDIIIEAVNGLDATKDSFCIRLIYRFVCGMVQN